MEVSDLSHGRTVNVEVTPRLEAVPDGQLLPDTEVALRFPQERDDVLLTWGANQVLEVVGVNRKAEDDLEELAHRDEPRLTWITQQVREGRQVESVILQTHLFAHEYRWQQSLELAVDEKILENVGQRYLPKSKKDAKRKEILQWLERKLVVRTERLDDYENAIIWSSGQNVEEREREDLTHFRLHGDQFAADIGETEDGTFRIERLVRNQKGRPSEGRHPLQLAFVDATPVDATVASEFTGADRVEVEQVLERQSSYLSLWEEYNRLELERTLDRAREVGCLPYKGYEYKADGTVVFSLRKASGLGTQLEELQQRSDSRLEALDEVPSWLQPDFELQSPRELVRGGSDASFAGELLNVDQLGREIRIEPLEDDWIEKPPNNGYLAVSVYGTFVSLRRRWRAHQRIRTSRSGLPQLELLLEEAESVPTGRHEKHEPITPRVREVFGDEPTEAQRQAIDIAINTPDIAVIQGPPGTGKTKTLTAIIARLAEIHDDDLDVSGHTLLSSFQHDAVEHAAGKTQVLGLPAVKIGNRSNGKDSELDPVERWRRNQINRLQERVEEAQPVDASERRLRDEILSFYASPPSKERALETLEWVLDETREQALLPGDLKDRLRNLQSSLAESVRAETMEGPKRRHLRRTAWRIRTEPASFADDGPETAWEARDLFERHEMLEPDEADLLQRAADWFDEESPPFLDELAACRNALLDRLLTDDKPVSARQMKQEVGEVLTQVLGELAERRRESLSGVDSALLRFKEDLEVDPIGVRKTIEDYTSVLAATCQQADSRAVSRQVGELTLDEEGAIGEGEFETVIVDEAARANPLDLFIPMVKANRRVILVGDHRQLPHLLDRRIEEELEDSSVEEKTREMLEKSLFERLYESLEERQRNGGPRRTRTLDVQFRMHPRLGEFVSENFYAADGGFDSERPAEEFQHELPGAEGRVAGWLEVPRTMGTEESGRSKSRPVEAEVVAKRLRKWMEAEPDLTFGVITFYNAQREELWKALANEELAEREDDGTFRVRKRWREVERDGEVDTRLEVGTVDAFQGKEFDVVFVSMTRSNDRSDETPADLRGKYGHLMLENRLCVAMSRQKRMLVVAGDSSMLRTDSAEDAIPGLVAFRQFCEGEHGTVVTA